MIAGTLSSRERIELGRRVHKVPKDYPFDPEKLVEPNGATRYIDLKEEQRRLKLAQKRSRPIGFHRP